MVEVIIQNITVTLSSSSGNGIRSVDGCDCQAAVDTYVSYVESALSEQYDEANIYVTHNDRADSTEVSVEFEHFFNLFESEHEEDSDEYNEEYDAAYDEWKAECEATERLIWQTVNDAESEAIQDGDWECDEDED